jgi:hypothetical protein
MTVETFGRAFDLYRRTADSCSAIALLIANAIPLIGVLFFGWSLLTILVLFWIENAIVGFWNLPRIWLAQGSVIPSLPDLPESAAMDATGNPRAAEELRQRWARAQVVGAASLLQGPAGGTARVGLSVFFLIHYGIFWAVHGIFVFALPSFVGVGGGCVEIGSPPAFPFDPGAVLAPCMSPFGEVVWSNVVLAAVALSLSHGASFFLNYVGKREYLTTSPTRQMGAPYGRVVVLHLTIIFGAFIIAILGAPIGALLVLVVVKTAFDLGLHLREHHGDRPEVVVGAAA